MLSRYIYSTGGIGWHYATIRYRLLHRSFRKNVFDWLDNWTPRSDELILIGPSAGWFLSCRFLNKFKCITAVDIDPLAKSLFFLTHGRPAPMKWINRDITNSLSEILAQSPNAAILFCNILGQIGVGRPDFQDFLSELTKILAKRRWASFHDRFSTNSVLPHYKNFNAISIERGLDAKELQRFGFSGVWTDHGTGFLSKPSQPRKIFPWFLTPTTFHLVEAVYHD